MSTSTTAERALINVEDIAAEAFAGLQIVDYLIENRQPELAYRATNPVFDALKKIREIALAGRGKEATS